MNSILRHGKRIGTAIVGGLVMSNYSISVSVFSITIGIILLGYLAFSRLTSDNL